MHTWPRTRVEVRGQLTVLALSFHPRDGTHVRLGSKHAHPLSQPASPKEWNLWEIKKFFKNSHTELGRQLSCKDSFAARTLMHNNGQNHFVVVVVFNGLFVLLFDYIFSKKRQCRVGCMGQWGRSERR